MKLVTDWRTLLRRALSDDAFKLLRWSTAETLIRLEANGHPTTRTKRIYQK